MTNDLIQKMIHNASLLGARVRCQKDYIDAFVDTSRFDKTTSDIALQGVLLTYLMERDAMLKTQESVCELDKFRKGLELLALGHVQLYFDHARIRLYQQGTHIHAEYHFKK